MSENVSAQVLRELRGYEGDKRMSQLAIETTQTHMRDQLLGEMGRDIRAVVSGEVKVDASRSEKRKFRMKSWLRRMFRRF